MKQFNRLYLEERLEELNQKLKCHISLYVLGGGAMSYFGLKDSTRDIDVGLKSIDEYEKLLEALHALKYRDVIPKHQSYLDMNTSAVLENPDGLRWDIFVKIICNGLQLSEGMIERAEKWLSYNNVEIYAVSPEDNFVFKSITSRERDRDDMNTLYIHGLDFNNIKSEMVWQTENSNDRAWLAFFYLGLEELKEKYGVKIPYFKEFYNLACNELVDHKILSLVQQRPFTIDELRLIPPSCLPKTTNLISSNSPTAHRSPHQPHIVHFTNCSSFNILLGAWDLYQVICNSAI